MPALRLTRLPSCSRWVRIEIGISRLTGSKVFEA